MTFSFPFVLVSYKIICLKIKIKSWISENIQSPSSVVCMDKLEEEMSKTIRTQNITLIMGNNAVQNHKIDYGRHSKVIL
jgi:hypothetical protein